MPLRASPLPLLATILLAAILLAPAGCASADRATDIARRVDRRGEEIMVAGQLFSIGTPVVLWTDPGGYDAYRTEYRFEPFDERAYDPARKRLNGPQRYNLRADGLNDAQRELVRGGGWTLDLLRSQIDQFVIHYDVCGTSRQCFRVLHDIRGLSVHFMLDIDGTIYQTLDLKERAWHAAQANTRSIGVEIANIGAYPPGNADTLDTWYASDGLRTRVTLPAWMGDGGVRTDAFVARPARPGRVRGAIHGEVYEMYDLTQQQYDALSRLTAALCTIFPNLPPEYPRLADGQLLTTAMPEEEWRTYRGLIGHWHLSPGKIDPGPAFQWDRVINDAKRLMKK